MPTASSCSPAAGRSRRRRARQRDASRCDACSRSPDASPARLGLAVAARRADHRLRRRADGERRLPDLACGRAAADPLARRRDRRRPLLRPRAPARALRGAAGRRTTSRCRALARVRVRVYERIEPLAPARLESYRQRRPRSRGWSATSTRSRSLHLRGLGPPLVALLAGHRRRSRSPRRSCPPPALVLAAGLAVGGVAVPALAGGPRPARGAAQAAARGELVGRARRAPGAARRSSSSTGREDERLRAAAGARRAPRPARPPGGARGRRRRRARARSSRARRSPACSPSRSPRTRPASSTAC